MVNPIKRRSPIIKDRRIEITLGLLLFLFGCVLIYDAFDARGKKMPWPASGLAPW